MGQETEGETGGRAPECPGSDKIQVSSLPSHCFLLQKKGLVTPSLRTKWGAWANTIGTQGLQLPPVSEVGAWWSWKKPALQCGLLPEARASASCRTHGLAGALHWSCGCSGTERDTYDSAHSKPKRCQRVHSWGLTLSFGKEKYKLASSKQEDVWTTHAGYSQIYQQGGWTGVQHPPLVPSRGSELQRLVTNPVKIIPFNQWCLLGGYLHVHKREIKTNQFLKREIETL